jgi:hypothetical protein
MSTAPSLPGTSPQKPPPDALAASVVLRAQIQAAQQITAQRLREAANATATTRIATPPSTNSSSSSRGSSTLNQVYSQVWSAVTRNVRQIAVRSSDANVAESSDADASVDEASECSNEDGVDDGNDGDTQTHGKNHKHGLERRGAGDRNGVKQKIPSQHKQKQNQQHKQKRKRRQSESIELDICDEPQLIDPWASAHFEYGSDVSAHRVLQSSSGLNDVVPIRRLPLTNRIDALSDTKAVLRETDLLKREYSNELIWALGVLAAILLALALIVGLSGHDPATESPAQPKSPQGASHHGQEDAPDPVTDKVTSGP